MSSEIRNCQNCKNPFTIEPEDFAFYEKMKVPPPTWCPQCRLIRRLASVSYRMLYKNKCTQCGKGLLAMFPLDTSFTVYCNACWWSDAWDPLSYGREYDFSRPFFEQYKELVHAVPAMALSVEAPRMVNSEYCNAAGGLKDCYLAFHADDSERTYYSCFIGFIKDSCDVLWASESELCYESSVLYQCYRCLYSSDCETSNNLYFCRDCIGCADCIGCSGLRNKQYYMFNKPHTKEAHEQAKEQMRLHTRSGIEDVRRKALAVWSATPVKYVHGKKYEDATGDYIGNANRVRDSFHVYDAEDCRYCALLYMNVKDAYDYSSWGMEASLIYDSQNVGQKAYNVLFSSQTWDNVMDIRYSHHCLNASNLFGCVGIRKNEYCILNKRYTKDEYEAFVPRIIQHMNDMPYIDGHGRRYQYGEYVPPEHSMFAYNESVAYDFFPKNRNEAAQFGARWRDPEERTQAPTLRTADIPDDIRSANTSITQELIECKNSASERAQCTKVFKIIKQELEFYKNLDIPLPTMCPQCRQTDRLGRHNPFQLWPRQCQCGGATSTNGIYTNTASHAHGASACGAPFQTAYSPDRDDIVYCTECYQKEIV